MFTKRPLTRLFQGVGPILALLLAPCGVRAQDKTDLQQILQRLERLEEENHKLVDEVHALRMEFAAAKGAGQPAESPPPQAQTADKVQRRHP